jgi:hypothetical protein
MTRERLFSHLPGEIRGSGTLLESRRDHLMALDRTQIITRSSTVICLRSTITSALREVLHYRWIIFTRQIDV